jgi:hypothetical protein
MTMIPRRLAFTLLVLCAPLTAAGQDRTRVEADTIKEAAARARSLVEAATGVKLTEGIDVVISTPDRIGRILLEELQSQFEVVEGDAETARKRAKATAAVLRKAMMAKYEWGAKRIHVSPENIERTARLLEEPKLLSPHGVRAVLVHEFVHAADDRKHDLHGVLRRLKTAEHYQAFAAVVEGHAQFVTRRIAAEHGWTDAFETFTRCIGKVPEDHVEGEALRLLLRVVATELSMAYREGERFIQAVHARAGDAGVAKVLEDPPRELELIHEPAWYLDPEKRPALTVRFEEALKRAAEGFDPESWTRRMRTLVRAQLEAALSLLPAETRNRTLDNAKHFRALILNPKAAPQSKMVMIGLAEHTSPEEAVYYLAAIRELLTTKDAKMRTGAIRIEKARYEEIRGKGWVGIYYEKTIAFRGTDVQVTGLNAIRGRLSAEITFSAEEADRDRLLEILDTLWREAQAPATKGDARK